MLSIDLSVFRLGIYLLAGGEFGAGGIFGAGGVFGTGGVFGRAGLFGRTGLFGTMGEVFGTEGVIFGPDGEVFGIDGDRLGPDESEEEPLEELVPAPFPADGAAPAVIAHKIRDVNKAFITLICWCSNTYGNPYSARVVPCRTNQ